MTERIAKLGLFLAVALILGYVESLIPFAFGIPGMKLGLANLAVLLTLYLSGTKDAFMVNVSRVILSGFLFGNLYSILYSLAGALLSFLVMIFVKRCNRFSIAGVSIAGGISHNIGQLLVAAFVVETLGLIYYIPVLLVAGTMTGMVNGLISAQVLKYLKPIEKKRNNL